MTNRIRAEYSSTKGDKTVCKVKLDGRAVWAVRRDGSGYRYHPKGGGQGERFNSVRECLQSLKGDD